MKIQIMKAIKIDPSELNTMLNASIDARGQYQGKNFESSPFRKIAKFISRDLTV
jgi:hypothetical protein